MSTSKTLSGALLLALQPLVLNAISVPATAYIIRSLGPHGHGQWATAVALVGVFTILTSLGLRPQFVRQVAQEPDRAGEFLGYQLGMRGVLTLGAMVFACIACLGLRYETNVLWCTLITSSGLLLTTVGTTFTDLQQGLQQIRSIATVGLVSGLVVTAATVIAVRYGVGPVGLSLAYLAGPVTNVVLQYVIVRRQRIPVRFVWDSAQVRTLMISSRAWTAHTLLNSVRDRLEPLALPKLVGSEAVSYFMAGSMFADRLTIIPDGLSTAYYPAIARGATDQSRAAREVRHLLILSLSICLAVAILLGYFADPIARILFPKSADMCRYVIQVTIWALPFAGLAYAIDVGLLAVGKQGDVARAGIWSQVITVGISIPLLAYGGLYGACWSYMLRFIAPLLFVTPRFVRSFPGLLPALPLARLVVCAAAMAGVLQAAVIMTPACLKLLPATSETLNLVLNYGLWGAMAALVYLVLLVTLGVLDRSELAGLLPKRRIMRTE